MLSDKLLTLTRQLYPKGRAFKMPFDGYLEKLHKALIVSEAQAFEDAKGILYSILPDTNNFTTEDATSWERRLGLITNESVSLEDRKLAIQRKLNYPGTIQARQTRSYLEDQLRSAGFDVYVFQNRFDDGLGGYYQETPGALSGGVGTIAVMHGDLQHGDNQHGSVFENLVANNIEEEEDKIFDIGSDLISTFFIGGSTIGTFANVDEERKNEFRQLILKLKPCQSVAYLFINYV